MPQLVVEILGNTANLEKSFKRASRQSNDFSKGLHNLGRGSISATASFVGLRKAVLSTSAAFLGGVGIVSAIKSTVKAAEESQQVLAQTKVAVKDAGLAWGEYSKQIEKATAATSKLSGFDDERLSQTFSTLVRRTGDVTEALKLNALAANVARGRNIELEAAVSLVLKASLGQSGALRRLGIDAAKGASSVKLLTLLQQKYAGAAIAYGNTAAGAQDRFAVALQNLQETVGAELLPSITKYLNKGADWLNQSKNQKRVADDVKQAIHAVSEVANVLKDSFDALAKATGGAKNAVELLAAAFIAVKINARAAGLVAIAGQVGRIGTSAEVSAAQVGSLRAALVRLKGPLLIFAAIEAFLHRKQIEAAVSSAARATTTKGAPSPLGLPFSLDPNDTRPNNSGIVPRIHFNFPGGPSGNAPGVVFNGRSDAINVPAGASGSGNNPLTAQQQLQVALAANPDNIKLLQQQAAHDRTAIAFAKRLRAENRISNSKFVTEVTAYEQDLVATLDHIASLTKKNARRISLPSRVSGRGGGIKLPHNISGEFQQLAAHFNLSPAAQVAQAKAEALNDTAGLLNLAKKARAAAQRALRSGHLSLQAQIDAWNVIGQANDALKNQTGGDTTKFRHVSTAALAKRLGLTGDAARRARAVLATLGAGGTVPGARSLAYAGGTTYVLNNAHFHGVTDIAKLEHQLAKRTQGRADRRRT